MANAGPHTPDARPSGGLEAAVGWLERSEALDRLAQLIDPAVHAITPHGRWLGALTGRWLGHPVHPLTVTVPIGCWIAASALDIGGGETSRVAARRLVGLGVVAAAPAVVTGAADWRDTGGAERRLGVAHALANHVTALTYGASWWARRRGAHRAGVGIGLMAAGVLAVAGHLGGHLAYRRGVGVNTTAFAAGPGEWTRIVRLEQLTIGRPHAVTHGDVVLMVLRRQDDTVVLEDRCTHRGGPLHQGHLDGSCVVCPWHGSAFDVTTGAVRRGPASAPQPAYQTRLVDGYIEVRRAEPGSLRTNPVAPSEIDRAAGGDAAERAP